MKYFWKLSDIMTLPLLLIIAACAIENSYAYGNLGAWLNGVALSDFVACQ